MSLPKSKVLNATKGVIASASLRYGSPKQSQSIVVNVNPSGSTEVKEDNENQSTVPMMVCYGNDEPNPYKDLTLPTTVEEYQRILMHKDRELQARDLIIEIIKSNPLIQNKYIIASVDNLTNLIKLLTGGESIEFAEKDEEVGCCGTSDKFLFIDKIYVRKNNELYNLKYNFPDTIQILESHRISHKIALIE